MNDQDTRSRWFLEFTPVAEEDLERLDSVARGRVLSKIKWLRDNFNNIVPLPLGGKYQGLFNLRVGDWRIVYEAEAEKRLLIVHLIDRRDKIYKRK